VETASPKINVLVFCRNYLVDDFRLSLSAVEERFAFHYLTDGVCPGVSDTRERFYARLQSAPPIAGWRPDEEDEAINRCRLLRELPRAKALGMLRSIASVFAEELDRIRPAFVYAQMVDEYVTHVLAELARRRGIAYIGNAGSYFPGHIQITQYWNGSAYDFREPDPAELDAVLKAISENTFRQNYGQSIAYGYGKHVASVLRYHAKRLVFWARGLRERDPLNVHYACLPHVVERRRLGDYPRSALFHADWREKLDALVKANHKPVLYHPLAFYPESTINYWIGNMAMLDYEAVVLTICKTLAAHFNVVVKEHIHMAGARANSFYEKLIAIPGVVNVPIDAFSNDVVAKADGIVIGGGSIGVEGYVRGLPILTFCNTVYWYQPSRATFLDLSNIAGWPELIAASLRSHTAASPAMVGAFVARCLKSTMRSEGRGQIWPLPRAQDLMALFAALEKSSPKP
jgi:hypothetical protein